MARADGDEHRARLLHPLGDPARPARVAIGEHHAFEFGRIAEPVVHQRGDALIVAVDRKSTRLNSSHQCATRMPSSARKKKQHPTKMQSTPRTPTTNNTTP